MGPDGFPVWDTAGPDRMIIALTVMWLGATLIAALARTLRQPPQGGPDA